MYKFSNSSEKKLATCHPRLQELMKRVILFSDFTILEGERDRQAQNAAFEAGMSKLKFPQSKHNSSPSNAVDIAPFPIDWKNRERFAFLAGLVLATAKEMDIPLRWGGDWDKDGELKDNNFDDLVHFELL